MSSLMSRPGGSAPPAHSRAIWFITFGDLLTLLLAFFLTIISLSPANPAVRREARRHAQENRQKNDPSSAPETKVAQSEEEAIPSDGIVFAATASDEARLTTKAAPPGTIPVALITFSDIEAAGGRLTIAFVERVRSEAAARGYQAERLRLEGCPRLSGISGGDFRGSGWLLDARRQLIDAGALSPSSPFRMSGAACAALTSDGNEPVARISFETGPKDF